MPDELNPQTQLYVSVTTMETMEEVYTQFHTNNDIRTILGEVRANLDPAVAEVGFRVALTMICASGEDLDTIPWEVES